MNDIYVSFLTSARNDSHRPNRAEIQNFSLNFLLEQLDQYKIPSEIIIVEWNYPDDRAPLSETIKIKKHTPWCTVRLVRVPPKYHQKYKHWQHKGFHYGAAINVGFQRARGQFVLHVASDVFLTDECLQFISQKKLDKTKFYRCDRYDVDSKIFEEYGLRGCDRDLFFKACAKNIKVHHERLDIEPSFKIANLHTNASGDFFLTDREAIYQVRGYKEGEDVGSLDVDSLTVHALHALGLNEEILPDSCRVYKGKHTNSTTAVVQQCWGFWEKKLEAFLIKRGLNRKCNDFRALFNYPKRRYSYAPDAIFDSFEANFLKPARRWAKKKPPFYLNDENWGLVNEDLEEIVF